MDSRGFSDGATGRESIGGARARLGAAFATLALAAGLGGCGLFEGKDADKTANWTVQRLYSEAEDEMSTGAYGTAIKYFEQIESRFPFGRYAQQAQMELAYAQYRDGEKELALQAADRFIKQYPNSPNVDYVYYLKGLDQLQRQPRLPQHASRRRT